jgi:recombination protein RecT
MAYEQKATQVAQPATQAVAKASAMDFPTMLEKYKDSIAKALPEHMKPDRMVRMALTEFRKTPKLQLCEPGSIFAAIGIASQMGLEIGMPGQAYLIPYGKECQLIVGYQGLVDLVLRTGRITDVYARCVYVNEVFENQSGTTESISHKPCFDGNRGPLRLVYAVAVFENGYRKFEIMSREDVEDVKRSSKSKNSGDSPWTTHEAEMWKKTAIRRLCKSLPKSSELHKALGLIDAESRGVSQKLNLEAVVSDTWTPPDFDDPDDVLGKSTEDMTASEKAAASVKEKMAKMTGKVVEAEIVNQPKTQEEIDAAEKAWQIQQEKDRAAKENGNLV